MLDDEEELDNMPYLPDVTPCRGRESLPGDSQVDIGFSRAELDALADLPDKEADSLKSNDPTETAEDLLRLRIQAAKRLKYGDD